jgi:ACR3 family arsenite transporter
MIIPMLLKIDFGALRQVKAHWRGIGVTLWVNWVVKPFPWLFSAGYSSGMCLPLTCPPSN